MGFYKIGGLELVLDTPNEEFFGIRCADYLPHLDVFKNEFDSFGNNKIEVIIKHVNDIIRDDSTGKVVSDDGYNASVKYNDKIIHYMNDGSQNFAKLVYDINYDKAYIEYNTDLSYKAFQLNDVDFDYIYAGNAFNMKMTDVGGIMIHSSAIAVNGVGLLFSAPSGTGKSTHTSLWQQCYGDKVTFINDDKPVIRFVKDKAIVCGTPFSGKTDINNNIQVPMGAYIYLERGETNSIELMTVKESLFCLSEQTIRASIDKSIYLRNLDSIEKIVKNVPCYRLKCTPTTNAVEVVYKEIFKNENK